MLLSNTDWLILTTIHIVVWIIVYRAKEGYTDSLDSFYLSSGLYWLIFVFAPAVWIRDGQTAYQGVEVMQYLPVGMAVFNLSYSVYAFSSTSRNRITTGRSSSEICYEDKDFIDYLRSDDAASQLTKYGWMLFGISTSLALLYFALTGRGVLYMLTLGQGSEMTIGSDSLGIYFLAQFSRSAIPGLLLVLTFQKKKNIFTYVAVYILVTMCFTSGSRNLALCVVISIVVMRYLVCGNRPNMIVLILAVILMFLFVGFVGTYRTEMRTGGDIDLSLLNFDGMIKAFMFNVEIFFPFFNIVGYTFSGLVDCHYGLGLLNILIQFIPRVIWPSKPANLGRSAFEAMYGSSFNGAAYPNIGEFFYELGIVGVILFMYIFAKKMKLLYLDAVQYGNPLTMIQYSIAFGYLMQFICRGHFASWALDFFFMFVPIILLKKIMYRNYLSNKTLIDETAGS